MEWRDEILRRFFLRWNDDVNIRDQKRLFNNEERFVIWLLSDKKCSKCETELELAEMDADHVERWADGGETILNNAQALCANCNRSVSAATA